MQAQLLHPQTQSDDIASDCKGSRFFAVGQFAVGTVRRRDSSP